MISYLRHSNGILENLDGAWQIQLSQCSHRVGCCLAQSLDLGRQKRVAFVLVRADRLMNTLYKRSRVHNALNHRLNVGTNKWDKLRKDVCTHYIRGFKSRHTLVILDWARRNLLQVRKSKGLDTTTTADTYEPTFRMAVWA